MHEIFGFLGPNAAGKTTTIKCIVTLTKPSEGSIQVFRINAISDPESTTKHRLCATELITCERTECI